LKLLSEGLHGIGKSRYRSAEYLTFKHAALPGDQTSSLPTIFGQGMMSRLQPAERSLMPPGFCNAITNIGHGIPLPRLSVLSMCFWLRLRAVCDHKVRTRGLWQPQVIALKQVGICANKPTTTYGLIETTYGWIPHNAGFGFLDIAGRALGVFVSLDRF
jgi:hypothetical protein